jgi:hypothetical protein
MSLIPATRDLFDLVLHLRPRDPAYAWPTPPPLQSRWGDIYSNITLEERIFPLAPPIRSANHGVEKVSEKWRERKFLFLANKCVELSGIMFGYKLLIAWVLYSLARVRGSGPREFTIFHSALYLIEIAIRFMHHPRVRRDKKGQDLNDCDI